MSSRIGNLENRINNLEAELEEITHRLAQDNHPNTSEQKQKAVANIEQVIPSNKIYSKTEDTTLFCRNEKE